MQNVVVVTMQTRHFEFKVARADEDSAKKALEALWAKHLTRFSKAEQLSSNMPKASFEELEDVFEVYVTTLDFDKGYIDREPHQLA